MNYQTTDITCASLSLALSYSFVCTLTCDKQNMCIYLRIIQTIGACQKEYNLSSLIQSHRESERRIKSITMHNPQQVIRRYCFVIFPYGNLILTMNP